MLYTPTPSDVLAGAYVWSNPFMLSFLPWVFLIVGCFCAAMFAGFLSGYLNGRIGDFLWHKRMHTSHLDALERGDDNAAVHASLAKIMTKRAKDNQRVRRSNFEL